MNTVLLAQTTDGSCHSQSTRKETIVMTERNRSASFLKDHVLIMLAMPFILALGIPAGKWLAFFVARTFGLSG